jgi:hypothetical protein
MTAARMVRILREFFIPVITGIHSLGCMKAKGSAGAQRI